MGGWVWVQVLGWVRDLLYVVLPLVDKEQLRRRIYHRCAARELGLLIPLQRQVPKRDLSEKIVGPNEAASSIEATSGCVQQSATVIRV